MDYRDWGSGELVRRSPRPEDVLDDGSGALGGATYPAADRAGGGRRRPAADSAQRYVPDWAHGEQPSGGGGRHRHEDDEEPAPRSPGRRARRQIDEATGGWQQDAGTGYPPRGHYDREPVSGGWAVDSPTRRPAAADPEPLSGGWSTGSFAEDRPARHSAGPGRRRTPDDDPGGLYRSAHHANDGPAATRWGGAARGARWDRTTERDDWAPAPAANPWDRSPEVDPWARPDDTSVGASHWNGGSERDVETGQWGRLGDQTREWNRSPGPDPDEPPETHRRYGRRETFWSGTRLAGDDPRWMDTPAAAPRSPAVDYPATGRSSAWRTERRSGPTTGDDRRGTTGGTGRRSATTGAERRDGRAGVGRPGAVGGMARRGTVPAGRRGGGGPDRQRSSTAADRAAIRRLERDLVEGERGGVGAALLCTVAWYTAPLLALLGWLFTLDSQAPAGCVTDVTGGGCESPRGHALASVISGAPQVGAALLASLLIAVVLRRAGGTWRAATVGLVSAVVGGGLCTVLFSALNDRPLG